MQEQESKVVEGARQEVETAERPRYHLGRVGRILLGVYAVLFVLFGLLAWWAHLNPVSPIDVAITREFQEHLSPWLQTTMVIISYPGNTLLLPLLIIIAAGAFWAVGLRLEAVTTVVLSAVSALLNVGLKLLVDRPRPNASLVEVLQHATGDSFPSGHVMAYLAFWGLLFSFTIILFRPWRWWRVTLLVVSALFIALVGPSRIYLGAHWASDVLGSYLIGGVLLGITLWIYLLLKDRGTLETEHMRTRMTGSSMLRTFPLEWPRRKTPTP